MRFLAILAHPLKDSFAASAASTIVDALRSRGHEIDFLDLYAEDFDPRLTVAERASYMTDHFDDTAIAPYIERLKAAEGLILVFPQWWFNLPAILKGFIDRVFAPGVAFKLDPDGGRLIPLLGNIRYFWVVTTTGSPWWIVHLYMGNPVKRLLKRGVAAFCSKGLDFRMLSLHNMDRSTEEKRKRFLDRVRRATASL